MERIDPKTVLPLLKAEHAHRYMWAARGARGHVLDAACGVGYGAPILMNNPEVAAYTGLDNSPDALAYAMREYAGKRRTFVCGDVYQLPFEDATFDSVVSLETIEHLEQPERAMAEFARVLKPDGVLLGSVPQKEYEELCTAAYGPNEFHKSQFDRATLEQLIKCGFTAYSIWTCWLSITSVLAPLDSTQRSAELEQQSDWGNRLGSLLFAATRGKAALLPAAESTSLLPAVDLVAHERATITWRDRAIANQTKMIDERDSVIKAMEQRLVNKKAENVAQSRLVDERDRLIRENELRLEAKRAENMAQARLVDERDRIIRENSAMIEGKSREIASHTKLIQERDGLIARQTAVIEERNAAIQMSHKLVQERDAQLTQKNDSITQLTQELQVSKQLQATTAQQLSAVQAECASAVGQLAAVRLQLSHVQERNSTSELLAKRLGEERDVAAAQLKAVSAQLAEHESLVKSQSDLIVKRAAFIKHLEFLIVDRDKAIIDMTKMIDERTDLIRKQDLIVASRDATIQSQLLLLAERDNLVAQQTASIASLEGQLGDAHAMVSSLQLTIASKNQDVGTLEQRINSLGGSLSMVRKELQNHLLDLERPAFCLRQTTRALVGLVRYDRTDGREGPG